MAGSGSTAYMLFLAAGVLVSFTIFGYAQEALTRGDYDGERFKFPTFLIFLQSAGNTLIAFCCLCASRQFNFSGGAPVRDWLVVSCAYLGAHYFGLSALSYIPFPMQVVCKSCKSVPVMFGEKIFAKKKHTREKEVAVLLMTVGVVAFALAGGNKKGGDDAFALTPELMFGLGLVLCALVCDGIYGPYQNTICNRFSPSPFHLMFNMNLYELMIASVLCISNGELTGALAFIGRHPEILVKIQYFTVTMGMGNLFIFAMQANYGALTVTITTTLRKLISVVFSVLWFGHALAPLQWMATAVVFLAPQISKQVCKALGMDSQADKGRVA